MSTTLEYSTADKKKLKTFQWTGGVSDERARRAIKMLKPVCFECQGNTWPPVPGWWNDCPHRPYERLVPKKVRIESYIEDEDGDIVLDEEATKRSMKTKMVLVPNIVEVIYHIQLNDHQGPLKFQTLKGFKQMHEAGYAPMCEAYGCGRAWPTFKSDEFGTYCSQKHAQQCALKEAEMFSLAGYSSDVGEQQRKNAMRQLKIDQNLDL